ncbi:MAG: TolC family protein [Zoogloeaceae bacterium]|nr:TolC family protein [Zoogloeaceae bacterium]
MPCLLLVALPLWGQSAQAPSLSTPNALSPLIEARSWRWHELATWTLAYAREVGNLDAEAARQKALAVDAGNAPKLFAGAGWSRVDEPDGAYRSSGVTTNADGTTARYAERGTGRDDYRRLEGSLGIRVSLLGSREAEQRDLLDARMEATDASEAGKRQALLDLHDAAALYNGYVRNRQRQQLAHWFLADHDRVKALLDKRVAAGRMLFSERQRLLMAYEQANFIALQAAQRQRQALRSLTQLSGHTLAPADLPPAGLPATCRRQEALTIDGHPELEAAQKRREWLDARVDAHHYDGMNANVSVSHGWQRDQGGEDGSDTAVGFSVQIPLEWFQEKKAARARDVLRREVADERARRTARRLTLEAESALERWQLAEDEVNTRLRDWAAAKEALRVARLRQPQFDGDGITRTLDAKASLWQAALGVLDALADADLAAADVAWFSPGCTLEEQPDDDAQTLLAEFQPPSDKEATP